ncbi:hydrophobin [Laccaria bicolor S238N-H82]|uniref:Hydrophobin n=1 Tax=Laccaria bicolor (strain S238N-H82 / ATCC MYA-4686) TaxID=486041 RepID=B0DG11_LACBS|nr:hydrophobin [Laccaria bicolor S238N-H82]EDR06559.1 hydrophobin [Laccaria bicolor S238N-H82]|eukprot:XP_001882931.1 hydrophobin [Laccaria bicolor S238N-H82]
MKFSRLSTALVLLASGAAVSATQTVTYAPVQTPPPASQCNTGALWCCNNTQAANGSIIAPLLALLGIVVDPITALLGSGCTSINFLGVGTGGMCTAQPVCCQNNNFSGLVVIGCTPVTLGV